MSLFHLINEIINILDFYTPILVLFPCFFLFFDFRFLEIYFIYFYLYWFELYVLYSFYY